MAYIDQRFPIENLNRITEREANAKRPIHQLHKWWARRLGSAFRMILLTALADDMMGDGTLWSQYYGQTPPDQCKGKLILDPFMGGGTTVIEALRLGCQVIGMDVNPLAWFIVKKSLEPIDLGAFDQHFKQIEAAVGERILGLYRTRCPNGVHQADVMYVFWVKKVVCNNCGAEIRLTSTIGGKFVCARCGQADEIAEWSRREGKLPNHEMTQIEYWCPMCKQRGLKQPDRSDIALYEKADQLFEAEKHKLPLGDAEIPEGYNTKQITNRGYGRFLDLFNPRQLLCLGWLLREILEIDDHGVKEIFLITFSDAVNENNMLCKYHATGKKIEGVFGFAYWPTDRPIENNVWGTTYGKDTFVAHIEKTKRAMQWVMNPYEMPLDPGAPKVYTYDVPGAIFSHSVEDVLSGKANLWIDARSSEDMAFLPDRSVDAIVTDPPYYGNLHYSELSDFFYVWLRLGLKGRYAQFAPVLTPKEREIEFNDEIGKNQEFYLEGLKRVFAECHRVLKDEAPMAFTFHHAQASAWASVLEALLKTGFKVRAVWPYASETRSGVRAEGIKFDMIVVCRKGEPATSEVAWEMLKDRIAYEAGEQIDRIRRNGGTLSPEDVFIITMGRAIATYSQHWPNVIHGGRRIDLRDAVEDIERLVDERIDEYIGTAVPGWLDPVSRAYLQHLARRIEVTTSYLVKISQMRGLDRDFWLDRQYIARAKKGVFKVLRPEARYDYLEELDNDGELDNLVDRAHYLYALHKKKAHLASVLERLGDTRLSEVLDALFKITRDDTYLKLRQMQL